MVSGLREGVWGAGLCSHHPSIHIPSQPVLSFSPPLDSKHPRADPTFLQRRELCFTLDGDIFVRYLSFKVRMARES